MSATVSCLEVKGLSQHLATSHEVETSERTTQTTSYSYIISARRRFYRQCSPETRILRRSVQEREQEHSYATVLCA